MIWNDLGLIWARNQRSAYENEIYKLNLLLLSVLNAGRVRSSFDPINKLSYYILAELLRFLKTEKKAFLERNGLIKFVFPN